MEKMYHHEVNCETGEKTIREYTAEEYAQYEIDKVAEQEIRAAIEAEVAAKEAAKQSGIAKLMALGLTEEEAQALTK